MRMQKQLGQLSFADGFVNGATNFLSEVDEVKVVVILKYSV